MPKTLFDLGSYIADSIDDARTIAARMLLQHRRAYAAHIFSEDQHIETIRGRDIASS